jgi:ABC-type lipoprotein release transport system permease subunit
MLAVGHALVTAVRRRGRELAMLKALGFTRRQMSATLAWQATTLGIVGIVVGLPLGVVLGRVLWASFAESLGVAINPVVPIGPLVLLTIGALALLNVVAFVPGRYAAGINPAIALQSE